VVARLLLLRGSHAVFQIDQDDVGGQGRDLVEERPT
jgi:hypothetical protein